MPSNSYINFLRMRIDVLRLMETHNYFSRSIAGRKHLGHLTRSAVIMLCAAWERYNEDLLLESIQYLCNSINNPHLLNKKIKKTISNKVKLSQNEIEPIELTNDGWKTVWDKYARIETETLNTPKRMQLEKLFSVYLGIDNYSLFWNLRRVNLIDDFVSVRGDIAHNGSQARYVRINSLRNYSDLIVQTAINIDSSMADELCTAAGNIALPWIKDYSKNIEYYRNL